MSSNYTSSISPTQAHTRSCDVPPPPSPQLNAVDDTDTPETSDTHTTEPTPSSPIYPDSPSLFPLFCPTEDDDETLPTLSIGSPPELRTGVFTGVGLVEPVTASADTSTRRLRRAGKLVLRRLDMAREVEAKEKEKCQCGSRARFCCEKDGCRGMVVGEEVVVGNQYLGWRWIEGWNGGKVQGGSME